MTTDNQGQIYTVGITSGNLDNQINKGGKDGFLSKFDQHGVKKWTKLFGSSADEVASDVVTDEEGYVYVSGHTDGSMLGGYFNGWTDAFIIKFSPDGKRVWNRQIGNEKATIATSVVVDEKYVYVTGHTYMSLDGNEYYGSSDIFVVKYDRYSGQKIDSWQMGGSNIELVADMELAPDGDLLLGGTSYSDLGASNQGSGDGFLLKMSPQGETRWTKLFGSTKADSVGGVAIDRHGDVYVAGDSTGSFDGHNKLTEDSDVFIIKFDKAGQKQWSILDGGGQRDVPQRIVVDDNGNLVISGYTYGSFDGGAPSNIEDTFAAVYSRENGSKLWARQIRQQTALGFGMAINSQGTFITGYVVGQFSGNSSYGGQDAFLWHLATQNIDTDNDGFSDYIDDFPNDPTEYKDTDNDGIGNNADTDDDGDGVLDTVDVFPLNSNETTDSDNDGIGNNTDIDGDNDGVADSNDIFPNDSSKTGVEWQTLQWGSDTYDTAINVAVDSQKNTYVIGVSSNGEQNAQNPLWLTKFGPDQSFKWSKELDFSDSSSHASLTDIAVDSNDNIYVTGLFRGRLNGVLSIGLTDGVLIKFKPNGDVVWTQGIGTSEDDNATHLYITESDLIFVTGETKGNLYGNTNKLFGKADVFVTKFDMNGNRYWTKLSGNTSDDEAGGVVVDKQGYVYITGRTDEDKDNYFDVFLSKFHPQGSPYWRKVYGHDKWDYVKDLAIDSEDGIYATGTFYNESNNHSYDIYIYKFNTEGEQLWESTFGTAESDYVTSLIASELGDIYVTGYSKGSFGPARMGEADIFLAKYTKRGQQQWLKTKGTAYFDSTGGLTSDNQGDIYLAGSTAGNFGTTSNGHYDAVLFKYNASEFVTDTDGDGVVDNDDLFPFDPNETIDTDGDGIGNNADTDDDNDGVPDADDTFPLDPTEYLDTDNDGLGNNADTDDDNDGVLDTNDAFPLDATETVDTDSDGVGDNSDAFPNDPNETEDTDGDGVGDNTDVYPQDSSRNGIEWQFEHWGTAQDDTAAKIAVDSQGNTYVIGRSYPKGSAQQLPNPLMLLKYNQSSELQWVKTFGDAEPANESYLSDVAVDQLDNVYVTGSAFENVNGTVGLGLSDGFLIKFDPSGSVQWTQRFGSAQNDRSQYLYIGGNNTVYVSGINGGELDGNVSHGFADVFVIKFDMQGQRTWTRTVGSPNFEYAGGLVVDSQENVYIAGSTEGQLDGLNSQNRDAFITKFNAQGDKQWTKLYGSYYDERVNDLAIDNIDNIYITGSKTVSNKTDIFISRINTDGVEVWTSLWGTVENDSISDTIVDADGNVFLVGYTIGSFVGYPARGGGDVLLAKFGSDGKQRWLTTIGSTEYEGGNGLAIDAAGNILVSGNSGGVIGDNPNLGGYDIFVLKYNANEFPTDSDGDGFGDYFDAFPNDSTEFVDTDSDGIGNNADTDDDNDGVPDADDTFPLDPTEYLDTDNDGLGNNADTDDDNDGVLDANDIFPLDANETTDADGDGVGDNSDAFPLDSTESTDTDGDGVGDNTDVYPNDASKIGIEWAAKQWGSDGDDLVQAMTMDGNENKYILAQVVNGSQDPSQPLVLVKYNKFMNQVWSKSFGLNNNNQYVQVTDIAVDQDDNVYVTGYAEGSINGNESLGQADGFLIKIGSEGVLKWTETFGSSFYDYSNSLAIDQNNNIFVAGRTNGRINGKPYVGGSDLFVMKFDDDGQRYWTSTIGSTENEQANSIAIDNQGYVYVAGITNGNFAGRLSEGYDFLVIKYDTNGAIQWTQTLGTEFDDFLYDISVDSNSNPYLYGSFIGTSLGQNEYDLQLAKLSSSSGFKQWMMTFGTNQHDNAGALTVDHNDNIYLTGSTLGNFKALNLKDDYDIFLAKYNTSGTRQWVTTLANEGIDYAKGIVTDAAGYVYLVGSAETSFGEHNQQGEKDIFLLKHNPIEYPLDSDNDGTEDYTDAFPNDPNESKDSDYDGVGDNADALPYDPNESTDTDNDGIGNNADTDDDSDGVLDINDSFPLDATETTDSDGDGVGDNADAFPNDSSETLDSDGDGVGDNADVYPGDASRNGIEWTAIQWGTEKSDFSVRVITDPNQNIYVGGHSEVGSAGVGAQMSISKFNQQYALLWQVTFGGTIGSNTLSDIALDSNGNIYAIGYFDGTLNDNESAGGTDGFIIKFDNVGVLLWTKTLATSENDYSRKIHIDDNDNVYVTGSTYGNIHGNTNSGYRDVFLTKFDINGERAWTQTVNGLAYEEARGVVTDKDGDIYITGEANGAIEGLHAQGLDAFVTRFNEDGQKVWTSLFGDADSEKIYDLVIDDTNHLYLVGEFENTTTKDALLIKSDLSGRMLWSSTLGTTHQDFVRDAELSDDGNLYIVGSTYGHFPNESGNGGTDIFVAKVDANGVPMWGRTVGNTAYQNGTSVSVATNGHIYLSGRTADVLDKGQNVGETDIYLMRYNAREFPLDSDNDGYSDDFDKFPTDPAEHLDSDLDRIGNNADTDDDNDGIPDVTETAAGLNPLDPSDANLDLDGDGISNLDESNAGTNINNPDSDGDTYNDAVDESPLDENVWDLTPPVLTLNGASEVTITVGDSYVDEGAVAVDNFDGDLTDSIVISGSVDTSTAGNYTLSYNVSDYAGNAAVTVARTVTVEDVVIPPDLPVVTPPSDITVAAIDASGTTATVSAIRNFLNSAEAKDASGGILFSITNDAPSVFPLGETVVTFSATDSAGLTGTAQGKVTIADLTSPVLSLIGSSAVTITEGDNYLDPGVIATDNVGGNIAANVIVTGSVDVNTVGTYALTYNVSDSAGNAANSATRTVTVVSAQIGSAPVVSAPANITVAAIDGSGTSATSWTIKRFLNNATASDAEDGIMWTVNHNAPSIFPLGVTTVTFSATDSHGNVGSDTATVTVADQTRPVISLYGSSGLTLNYGENYIEAGATASDNVDGNITDTIVQTGSVNSNVSGTYSIAYNVSDQAGNNATTVYRYITVMAAGDTTPPVVTPPADITVAAADANGTAITTHAIQSFLSGGYAFDDTDGILFTVTHDAPAVFGLGVNTVTFSATDSAGNTGSAQATVTVNDVTAPVISLLGATTLTLEVGDSFVDAGATAVDNVDGDLTGVIIVSGSVDTSNKGIYSLSYSVTDAAGNTAAAVTRSITVQDTNAPLVTPHQNVIVAANDENGTPATDIAISTYLAATAANDIADGVLTNITNDAPAVFPLGTTTVTSQAVDSMGNTGSAQSTVTVVDLTAPVISLNDSHTVLTVGSQYQEAGAGAFDNVDGDLSGDILVDGTVDTTNTGLYVLNYNVTDAAGNVATTVSRSIAVQNTQAPVVTSPANIIVEAVSGDGIAATESVIVDWLATVAANDAIDGALHVIDDIPTILPLGITKVTFSATDSHGNIGQSQSFVTVVDTTPATFRLHGENTVTIVVDGQYSEPGFVAMDGVDGDIRTQVITNGGATLNKLGLYHLSYNVTDAAGNAAPPLLRSLMVVAADTPIISVPANIEVTATDADGISAANSAIVTFLTGASALDVNNQALNVTHNAPSHLPKGVTLVTFSAIDGEDRKGFGQATITVR